MTSLTKNNNKQLIWVLKDDRPGNYSQAISLAQSLNISYIIKEISYNQLAILPNLLKFGLFSTIKHQSKTDLVNQKIIPNIVICAGRRSALIALDLKKIYKDLFLIGIMNPGNNIIGKFNLIIAPFHDNLKYKNVISIPGAFTYKNKDLIKAESNKFHHIFSKIKQPKIALLIGGSSKKNKFNNQDIINLRKIINNISNKMKANLLITTSRRTDKMIIEELSKLNNVSYFFKWQKETDNPYYAILENADYIIVTGDSISMCCEAINFNKPVYIYLGDNICSKKHLSFHANLFKTTGAKKLTRYISKLEKIDSESNYNPQATVKLIKEIISNNA